MGFKQIRTSDLSGAVLDDKDVVTVIVKGHTASEGENRVFDATRDELASLKTVDGLIELEMKVNGDPVTNVFCTQTEFAKLVSDDQVKSFDSARGRRSGFRPGNGG